MLKGHYLAAVVIAVILLALGVVSLATPDWVNDGSGNTFGLWKYCPVVNSSCIPFNGIQADYIKAIQAFHIIGLVSAVAAIVVAGLGASKQMNLLRSVASCFFGTALCFTVSMAVFTQFYGALVTYYYGYSYILGWVAVGVAVIATAVYRVESRDVALASGFNNPLNS